MQFTAVINATGESSSRVGRGIPLVLYCSLAVREERLSMSQSHSSDVASRPRTSRCQRAEPLLFYTSRNPPDASVSVIRVMRSSDLAPRLTPETGRQPTSRRTQCWTKGTHLSRTDEWTNGRTDERTNGRTDERTNGRTDERTNGRTDERTSPITVRIVSVLLEPSSGQLQTPENQFLPSRVTHACEVLQMLLVERITRTCNLPRLILVHVRRLRSFSLGLSPGMCNGQ